MITPEDSLRHTIAIVSGKGGSGKTIIAAVMTQILDAAGESIILVDADTGTAGLTFYFGLELVDNTSAGLTDFFLMRKDRSSSRLLDIVRPIRGLKNARFLGAGDFRRFPKRLGSIERLEGIRGVIGQLKQEASFVIFDCRGGLDEESLAVCECVDEILLIVETDTTSYQATQRLVDILSENGLAGKLKGFMINKVFDNPLTIARNGTAAFRCDYLSAIPFDFEAMREFFTGRIPRPASIFGTHVQHGLRKAFPEQVKEPPGRVYRFDEYEEIGFVNLDSLRGGVVLALFITPLAAIFFVKWFNGFDMARSYDKEIFYYVLALSLLGLVASIGRLRQAVGHAVNRLVSIALFTRRSRGASFPN